MPKATHGQDRLHFTLRNGKVKKLTVLTTMPKQFILVVGATNIFAEISKRRSLRTHCDIGGANLAINDHSKDIINIIYDVKAMLTHIVMHSVTYVLKQCTVKIHSITERQSLSYTFNI